MRRTIPLTDFELAIMIFALMIWRHYLLGQKVEVYIDHKSLKYILIQKELIMRQRRWLELVTDYDLDIMYHPDKANVALDVLSRKPMRISLAQQKEILKDMEALKLEMVLHRVTSHLINLQLQSPLINIIKKSQVSYPRLQKLREKIEAGKETGVSVYLDGLFIIEVDFVYHMGKLSTIS